jgi:hypothetical protein
LKHHTHLLVHHEVCSVSSHTLLQVLSLTLKRELDQEAVPEWKAKYLNYKGAKKRLKAVNNALRDFNRTPSSTTFRTPIYDPVEQITIDPNQANDEDDEADAGPEVETPTHRFKAKRPDLDRIYSQTAERQPLVGINPSARAHLTRYGSIIGSPPRESSISNVLDKPPSLKLPEPAISGEAAQRSKRVTIEATPKPKARATSAYEAGETHLPHKGRSRSRVGSLFHSLHHHAPIHRLFSISHKGFSPAATPDHHMDIYRALENSQTDFFGFLDKELDKIETFYKEKEDEATQRLSVLRDQLHILRDRRMEDLIRNRKESSKAKRDSELSRIPDGDSDEDENRFSRLSSWFSPVERVWTVAMNGKVGRKSVAMETAGTPEAFRPIDQNRDYVRRRTENAAGYRTAKRKLKLAFLEYYRGLELLKSYAILNRTAFRKINKKYDKATGARPTQRYMNEKVSKAWFVKSDVLDGHIQAVEDLYARYFEAGNHKIAANKLRKVTRVRNYHGDAMFRNGLFLGAGSVFGGLGLEMAYKLIHSPDTVVATQAGYLLQIYAGYFLVIYLMLFFAFDCLIWTKCKVNYAFIFELDSRDHLDWRQIFELPSFLYFLLGFFIWVNFVRDGVSEMFIYYPVILIVFSFLVLFCPLPILYWRARSWFLIACVCIRFHFFDLTNEYSSDWPYLAYFQLNFETFSLEICFAL